MNEIIVDKSWGSETWFVNNHLYCGKMLKVDQNKWTSEGRFHYHKQKDETFFVLQGLLQVDFVTLDNEFFSVSLRAGQAFRILPNMRHRFTALNEEGCVMIETSTTHRDEDSYRCSWDKEKREWIED